MHRPTSALTAVTFLLFATMATAQEPAEPTQPTEAAESAESTEAPEAPEASDSAGWARPLEGIEGPLFQGNEDVGVMLVTPADDDASAEVRELVQQHIIASGMVDVVMDDAPLGGISARSDDEIIAAAQAYPVDVIVIIRAYPGADGMTAVMRVQTISDETLSFRMVPGGEPPWSSPKQPKEPQQPKPTVEERAEDVARQKTEARAREWAAYVRMGAVGTIETIRLIAAENARRELRFEPSRTFGTMFDLDGDRVGWSKAYEWIDSVETAKKFRRRRAARTAAMVTGGVLAAGGLGVLFVSLTNQANCRGDESGCGRPALIGAGAIGVSLGTIGLVTGALIKPHPLSRDQVEQRLQRYNEQLRSASDAD